MAQTIDKVLSQEEEIVTPPTMKVGEKEYTPEDVEQLVADRQQLEDSKKSLQADYTRKAQKLAEYEKGTLRQKIEGVASGEADATMSEQEIADMQYLSKLGFVPKTQLDAVLTKLDEVESKFTSKERDQKLKEITTQIDSLQAEHKFIDKQKLTDYMIERAKTGTVLAPDEAAYLLYKTEFGVAGKRPAPLPGFEGSPKARQEVETSGKPPALDSKQMNDLIRTRLLEATE